MAKLQLWDPGTPGTGGAWISPVVLRVKSTDPEESNGGGAVNGLE